MVEGEVKDEVSEVRAAREEAEKEGDEDDKGASWVATPATAPTAAVVVVFATAAAALKPLMSKSSSSNMKSSPPSSPPPLLLLLLLPLLQPLPRSPVVIPDLITSGPRRYDSISIPIPSTSTSPCMGESGAQSLISGTCTGLVLLLPATTAGSVVEAKVNDEAIIDGDGERL